MMSSMEKSDSEIVAVKSANKGTSVPAESMERRIEPKGNLESQSTRRAQDRESVTQAADRIGRFVQREPRERLTSLLHHVTVEAPRWSFFELKKDAAAGADGSIRPLGIAAIGDKIVQKAVMETILTPIL